MECCYLLTLNKDLNLEAVKELLKKNCSIIPERLENVSGISIEDKCYDNYWKYNECSEYIKVSKNVRYFTVEGYMEILLGSYTDKEGNIKKKKDRMSALSVEVVFLEIEDGGVKNCFALISQCKTNFENVKMRLFCAGRKSDKELRDKWGLRKENGVLSLNSEFFLWILINCKNKKIYDMDIIDIHHIHDKDESNNRHHSTEGGGVLNDVLANTALSLNPELIKIGTTIENKSGFFKFKLTCQGELEISEKSNLKDEDGNTVPFNPENNASEVIANIYGNILPNLLRKYKEDLSTMTWRSETAQLFLEQQGKKAILDLAVKFGLLNSEEREKIKETENFKIEIIKQ